jgi:hypothetical protein
MKITRIIIAASFLMFHLACEEKKPITQELCESKTNRADCEAAGCTFACGTVLVEKQESCIARRNVGRCLAVKKFVRETVNNSENYWAVYPNQTRWFFSFQPTSGYSEYFRITNDHTYPVEIIGYRTNAREFDPCIMYDPEGDSVPWEGSCETDWWSQDMWDDVLAK